MTAQFKQRRFEVRGAKIDGYACGLIALSIRNRVKISHKNTATHRFKKSAEHEVLSKCLNKICAYEWR